MEERKILVINTGSTTTKVAVFVNGQQNCDIEVTHDYQVLGSMHDMDEQAAYRRKTIDEALQAEGVSLEGLSAIACRGGTFGSVKGGAYLVEDNLLYACHHPATEHASNLSAIVGKTYADDFGCKAYIYDAVCTNELPEIATVSGLEELPRTPFSHTLNTRACAHKVAEDHGVPYEDQVFIVVHMGGGLSINVHDHGRIVDVVSDDEGPMSPERAGKLNTINLIKLCYSGKYDMRTMLRQIKGEGGLLSHLGTSNMKEITARIEEGDEKADFILSVMAYQVAKDIGSLSTVVFGKVDHIILTGGCAHSKLLTGRIRERVEHIAPVTVIPGAMEMEALEQGITRVLNGQETCRVLGQE